MNLFEIIREARRHLQENGCVSLRVLRRQSELDDDALEEVIEELVDVQRVARREGNLLVWAEDATVSARAPESTPGAAPAQAPVRDPRAYTPQHLADKILQSKSALEACPEPGRRGERKQVTVLFADVKGSMELAEQLDMEAWSAIMQRFFMILADGVERFDGFADKFTGDGIMALFGAPITHEDHAQRACYAALRLQEQLRAQADQLRLQSGLSFSVRIGLNSGEVVVGSIGDDLRMEYTAQGYVVGLASRMEQICEPGRVYLTEHTARLVDGYVAPRDLGETRVENVSRPIRVHELLGVGALRTRVDLSRARGLSKFVGQQSEMQTLEQALADARQGRGQVVGVVGYAGVGTSRLCFEFTTACRARGLRVSEAHGVSHERSAPPLPVLELFRSYFAITREDDDRTAREKIAGRMLLLDPGFADVLLLMFDFLGVPDPARPAPEMSGDARQHALFGVMRRLAGVQSQQPGCDAADSCSAAEGVSSVRLLTPVAECRSRSQPLPARRPSSWSTCMQSAFVSRSTAWRGRRRSGTVLAQPPPRDDAGGAWVHQTETYSGASDDDTPLELSTSTFPEEAKFW
jgi:class 3 adenylate cyclase